MAENRDQVSVDRVIAAPPEKIFELLADPASHPKIDGSGTVREAKGDGPARLSLGSTFEMSMKMGLFGRKKLFGGRIWRYELEPVDGGTRVRETWDISQEKLKAPVRPAAKHTREAMSRTLARIE